MGYYARFIKVFEVILSKTPPGYNQLLVQTNQSKDLTYLVMRHTSSQNHLEVIK
jgi:hypothetical protein